MTNQEKPTLPGGEPPAIPHKNTSEETARFSERFDIPQKPDQEELLNTKSEDLVFSPEEIEEIEDDKREYYRNMRSIEELEGAQTFIANYNLEAEKDPHLSPSQRLEVKVTGDIELKVIREELVKRKSVK